MVYAYLKSQLRIPFCRYVGFYKGVQSAGAVVAWQVDQKGASLMSQLIVNWSLTTISYPLLVVLIYLAVKDENSSDEKDATSIAAAPSAPPEAHEIGDSVSKSS